MTADTHESTEITESTFTAEEARALEALHIRYQADHDLFSSRELARLRFLRWRAGTGRLRTHMTARPQNHSPRRNAA
jgi:hypothetical protein